MPDALPILGWTLVALASLGPLAWLIVLGRVRRALRSAPRLLPAASAPPEVDPPLVSVVVPAHDEARVIAACARSLLAQDHPRLELIFVLDRCTDATREILDRTVAAAGPDAPPVRVVELDRCPDDWAGKCHAAAAGAAAASAAGEWLLFTDADTRFDPRLVRASLHLARERDLDLLSLLSTLAVDRPFEWIVQPVAAMNLLRLFPIERVNRDPQVDPRRARPFANGQFLLFRRAAYERLGGHAAVRDDLLEDIAFARLLKRSGGRGGLALDDRMLACSMYDSWDRFREGWKRIYTEACKRKVARLRRNALQAFLGGVGLPLVQVAALAAGLLALRAGETPLALAAFVSVFLGWGAQAIALAWIYRLAGSPLKGIPLFPVGSALVGAIFLRAARDLARGTPIRWAGRDYVLKPR